MGLCCSKQQSSVLLRDAPNKVEFITPDEEIQLPENPHERFKYNFPFHKINVNQFFEKLNKIEGIECIGKDTDLISLNQLQDQFQKTDFWKLYQNNFEKLLRTPEFKSIVINERLAIQMNVPQNHLINYTTKLELGVLALLWCSGTQKEKAQHFCNLANSKNYEYIAQSDDELKFIFVKILIYSTDLPVRYEKDFQLVQSDNKKQLKSQMTDKNQNYQENATPGEDLFTISQIIKEVEQSQPMLEQVYSDQLFYENLFLDQLFGYQSRLTNAEFIDILSDPKFEWLFDTLLVRQKVFQILNDGGEQ